MPAPALVTRADARAGLLTALLVAVLGAPVGMLWAAVTPRAELAGTGDGGLRLVDPETRAFATTDGAFFVITLGIGLLLGVLAWRLGRRQAVGVVVGLVLGAALAAVVALETGQLFDARLGSFEGKDRSAAAGVPLTLPNELLPDTQHPRLLLLAWPAGAALAFTVLAHLQIGPPAPRPALQAAPQGASWGSRAPGRSPRSEPPAAPAAGPPPA